MNLLLDINPRTIEDASTSAFGTLKNVLKIVLPVALGVVLLIGAVYAIILGVNYSKAEDSEKRKKAREHLVGAIVGFLITLIVIAIIYAVIMIFIPDGTKKQSKPFEDYQFEQEVSITKDINFDTYTLTIGSKIVEAIEESSLDPSSITEITSLTDRKALLGTDDITIAGFKISNADIQYLYLQKISDDSIKVFFMFKEGSMERNYETTKAFGASGITSSDISSGLSISYNETTKYTISFMGKSKNFDSLSSSTDLKAWLTGTGAGQEGLESLSFNGKSIAKDLINTFTVSVSDTNATFSLSYKQTSEGTPCAAITATINVTASTVSSIVSLAA